MSSHAFPFALALGVSAGVLCGESPKLKLPIPDKLVVLTFDDGNISDLKTVAPILKEYGFGATFFITSGWLGGDRRLRWPEVKQLQDEGFEIGCHTTTHPNLLRLSDDELREQVVRFDRECAAHGVVKATSFSYPGGHFDRRIVALIAEQGYTAARRGRDPEFPLEDNGGTGRAYSPGEDDPYLIPSTMTRGISALADEQITLALGLATGGKVAVFTYHGVPDVNRHCSTPIERFRADMKYLKDSGAKVIAMRDLSRYVDLSKRPEDPFAPIVRRLGLGADNLKCDTSGEVPLFSWELQANRWTQKQVAYRILVASSREQIDRDVGDLWDSGKIDAEQRTGVPYRGKALEAGVGYWWKVQCWNRRDRGEVARNAPYQSKELVVELRKTRPGPFAGAARFEITRHH